LPTETWNHAPAGQVDGADGGVVFIGDEHGLAVLAQEELLRVLPGADLAQDFAGLAVDHFHRIVVAHADQHEAAVASR
jgi:DNA-binding NtrC family response regulator